MAAPDMFVVIPVNTPVVTDDQEEIIPSLLTNSRMIQSNFLALKPLWQKERHDNSSLSKFNVPALDIKDHVVSGFVNMDILSEKGMDELAKRTRDSKIPPTFAFNMGTQPMLLTTVKYTDEIDRGQRFLKVVRKINSVRPSGLLCALPGWAKPGETPLLYEIQPPEDPDAPMPSLPSWELPEPLAQVTLEVSDKTLKINPFTGTAVKCPMRCNLIYDEVNGLCTGRTLICSPEIMQEDLNLRGGQTLAAFKTSLDMRSDRTFFFQIPTLADFYIQDLLEREVQAWLWPLVDRSYGNFRKDMILEAVDEARKERAAKINPLPDIDPADKAAWIDQPLDIELGDFTKLLDLADEKMGKGVFYTHAVLPFDNLNSTNQLEPDGYLVAVEFSHVRFKSPFDKKNALNQGGDPIDDLSHLIPSRVFVKKTSDLTAATIIPHAFDFNSWNDGRPGGLSTVPVELALRLAKSSLVVFHSQDVLAARVPTPFPSLAECCGPPFPPPAALTFPLGPFVVPINNDTLPQLVNEYPPSLVTVYNPRSPLPYARAWEVIVRIFCAHMAMSERESASFGNLVRSLICWEIYPKPSSKSQVSVILEIGHSLEEILHLRGHFNGNRLAGVFFESQPPEDASRVVHNVVMKILKATIDPVTHPFPQPSALNWRMTPFVKAQQFISTFTPIAPRLAYFEAMCRDPDSVMITSALESSPTLGEYLRNGFRDQLMLHPPTFGPLGQALNNSFHPQLRNQKLLNLPHLLAIQDKEGYELELSLVLSQIVSHFKDVVLGDEFKLIEKAVAHQIQFQYRTVVVQVEILANITLADREEETWRVTAFASAIDLVTEPDVYFQSEEDQHTTEDLMLGHPHVKRFSSYFRGLIVMGLREHYKQKEIRAFALPANILATGTIIPPLKLTLYETPKTLADINFGTDSPWIPTELHAKVAAWLVLEHTRNEEIIPPLGLEESLDGTSFISSAQFQLTVAMDIALEKHERSHFYYEEGADITKQAWAHTLEGVTSSGKQLSKSLFMTMIMAKIILAYGYEGLDDIGHSVPKSVWLYATKFLGALDAVVTDSTNLLEDSTFLPFGIYFRELKNGVSQQLRDLLSMAAFLGINPHLVCPHPKKRGAYTVIPLLPQGEPVWFLSSGCDSGTKWSYLSDSHTGIGGTMSLLFAGVNGERPLTIWQFPNVALDTLLKKPLFVGGHDAATTTATNSVVDKFSFFKTKKNARAVECSQGGTTWKIYNFYTVSDAPDFHNFWWQSSPSVDGPMTFDEILLKLKPASNVNYIDVKNTGAEVESLVEVLETKMDGMRLTGPEYLHQMAIILFDLSPPGKGTALEFTNNFRFIIDDNVTAGNFLRNTHECLDFFYTFSNANPPVRGLLDTFGRTSSFMLTRAMENDRAFAYLKKLKARNQIKTALFFACIMAGFTAFSTDGHLEKLHPNYKTMHAFKWKGKKDHTGKELKDNLDALKSIIAFLNSLTDEREYMDIMDADESLMMTVVMGFCAPYFPNKVADFKTLWEKIRQTAGFMKLPFDIASAPVAGSANIRADNHIARHNPDTFGFDMWPMVMLLGILNNKIQRNPPFVPWRAGLPTHLISLNESVLTSALALGYLGVAMTPDITNELNAMDTDSGLKHPGIKTFIRLLYEFGGDDFRTNNAFAARLLPLIGTPLTAALYAQMLVPKPGVILLVGGKEAGEVRNENEEGGTEMKIEEQDAAGRTPSDHLFVGVPPAAGGGGGGAPPVYLPIDLAKVHLHPEAVSAFTRLKTDQDTLTSAQTALKTQVDGFSAAIARLETTQTTIGSNMTTLNTNMTTLGANVTVMGDKVVALDGAVGTGMNVFKTGVSTALGTLTRDVTAAVNSVGNNSATILGGFRTDMNTAVGSIRAENNTMVAESVKLYNNATKNLTDKVDEIFNPAVDKSITKVLTNLLNTPVALNNKIDSMLSDLRTTTDTITRDFKTVTTDNTETIRLEMERSALAFSTEIKEATKILAEESTKALGIEMDGLKNQLDLGIDQLGAKVALLEVKAPVFDLDRILRAIDVQMHKSVGDHDVFYEAKGVLGEEAPPIPPPPHPLALAPYYPPPVAPGPVELSEAAKQEITNAIKAGLEDVSTRLDSLSAHDKKTEEMFSAIVKRHREDFRLVKEDIQKGMDENVEIIEASRNEANEQLREFGFEWLNLSTWYKSVSDKMFADLGAMTEEQKRMGTNYNAFVESQGTINTLLENIKEEIGVIQGDQVKLYSEETLRETMRSNVEDGMFNMVLEAISKLKTKVELYAEDERERDEALATNIETDINLADASGAALVKLSSSIDSHTLLDKSRNASLLDNITRQTNTQTATLSDALNYTATDIIQALSEGITVTANPPEELSELVEQVEKISQHLEKSDEMLKGLSKDHLEAKQERQDLPGKVIEGVKQATGTQVSTIKEDVLKVLEAKNIGTIATDQQMATVLGTISESLKAQNTSSTSDLKKDAGDLVKATKEMTKAVEGNRQLSEEMKKVSDDLRRDAAKASEEINKTSEEVKVTSREIKEISKEVKKSSKNLVDTSSEIKKTSEEVREISREVKEISQDIKNTAEKINTFYGAFETIFKNGTSAMQSTFDSFNNDIIPRLTQQIGLKLSSNETLEALGKLDSRQGTLITLLEDLKHQSENQTKTTAELEAMKVVLKDLHGTLQALMEDMKNVQNHQNTFYEWKDTPPPSVSPDQQQLLLPPPENNVAEGEYEDGHDYSLDPLYLKSVKEKERSDPEKFNGEDAIMTEKNRTGDGPLVVERQAEGMTEALLGVQTMKAHMEELVKKGKFAISKVDASTRLMIKAWLGVVWSDDLKEYLATSFGGNWLVDMALIGFILRANLGNDFNTVIGLVNSLVGMLQLTEVKRKLTEIEDLQLIVNYAGTISELKPPKITIPLSNFCIEPCYPAIGEIATLFTGPLTEEMVDEINQSATTPRWIFGEALAASRKNTRHHRPSSRTHRAFTAWALTTLVEKRDPQIFKAVTGLDLIDGTPTVMPSDFSTKQRFESPVIGKFDREDIEQLSVSMEWGDTVKELEGIFFMEMMNHKTSSLDTRRYNLKQTMSDLLEAYKIAPNAHGVTVERLIVLACFMANDVFTFSFGKYYILEKEILELLGKDLKELFETCITDRDKFSEYASTAKTFFTDVFTQPPADPSQAIVWRIPWVNTEPQIAEYFWLGTSFNKKKMESFITEGITSFYQGKEGYIIWSMTVPPLLVFNSLGLYPHHSTIVYAISENGKSGVFITTTNITDRMGTLVGFLGSM